MSRLSTIGKGFERLPEYAGVPAQLQGREGDVEAVYVHVPFCSTKCHYCDFYSVAGHLDKAGAYLEALEREMRAQVAFFGRPRPRTVFVGGGTPTLLEPRELERLLGLIGTYADLGRVAEFTVDLAASRAAEEPVIRLFRIGTVARQ